MPQTLSPAVSPDKPKLLDQVRNAIRVAANRVLSSLHGTLSWMAENPSVETLG